MDISEIRSSSEDDAFSLKDDVVQTSIPSTQQTRGELDISKQLQRKLRSLQTRNLLTIVGAVLSTLAIFAVVIGAIVFFPATSLILASIPFTPMIVSGTLVYGILSAVFYVKQNKAKIIKLQRLKKMIDEFEAKKENTKEGAFKILEEAVKIDSVEFAKQLIDKFKLDNPPYGLDLHRHSLYVLSSNMKQLLKENKIHVVGHVQALDDENKNTSKKTLQFYVERGFSAEFLKKFIEDTVKKNITIKQISPGKNISVHVYILLQEKNLLKDSNQ